MKKSDFYYDLPEELIAQHPAERRDGSRLLLLDKQTGEITHKMFSGITDLLKTGDCLILNNTRVLPARLYATAEDSGGVVEFLLLNQINGTDWEILAGPGKKAKKGRRFLLGGGLLHAEIIDVLDGGNRIARFSFEGGFFGILDQIGEMPLPHYKGEIEKKSAIKPCTPDCRARHAPTAVFIHTGLLDSIRQAGLKPGL